MGRSSSPSGSRPITASTWAPTLNGKNPRQGNTVDDAKKPYRYRGRATRMIGYAGPANARAGEIYSKYVITDMFAKGVQGMKPEDAVKWAEGELKKVYES